MLAEIYKCYLLKQKEYKQWTDDVELHIISKVPGPPHTL